MKQLVIVATAVCIHLFAQAQQEIKWNKMGPEVFEKAKSENKVILLNLEANWCHWCHVMEDETYSNTAVKAYIDLHFIAVKADQDRNPDLSIRYKNYGWPATIFINGSGEDVVKRAGFIRPENFLNLLQAIVRDPSPELEETSLASLLPQTINYKEAVQELDLGFRESLDYTRGGFDQAQKYVDYDTYEYAGTKSADTAIQQWIDRSVAGAKQLSDPAWGGMYQYSTHNDWEHLHFEKLLSIQARYIHIFLRNYVYQTDLESLERVKAITNYVNRFLVSKNGSLYNAQDADLIEGEHAEAYFALADSERLKQGIPRVDTSVYTHNNARYASALLQLYWATHDKTYEQQALQAMNNLKPREENGLYAHSNVFTNIKSMQDNVAMAAFLVNQLKNNPSDLSAKNKLTSLFDTLLDDFQLENGAFVSFSGSNGLKPEPIISENIEVARLLNWFAYFSENKKYTESAKRTVNFLTNPKVMEMYVTEPALLLLIQEIETEPFHFVLLDQGAGSDEMLQKARSMASFYSLFNQYKRADLPANKVDLFEGFTENVLLMCTSSYCSAPVYKEVDVLNLFVK
jgi:uncharacterized protein YyaL (SSP411 family)